MIIIIIIVVFVVIIIIIIVLQDGMKTVPYFRQFIKISKCMRTDI